MRREFQLRHINPNPFRKIEAYPIQEDKITALRESIRETGFWNNLVARETDSGAEIAYGHHRMEALRREFDPDHVIELEVRDLSDEQMLKIMARENMEEWGTSASIEMETVRAVVEAFADGRINLEAPDANTDARYLRYAPSFIRGLARDRGRALTYTSTTVGDFLGWLEPSGRPQEKVKYCLNALELVERDILSEKDVAGLSTKQVREQVKEARRAEKRKKEAAKFHKQQAEQAKREAESAPTPEAKEQAERRAQHSEQTAEKFEQEAEESARKVGKTLGEKMREGKIGANQARSEAEKIQKPKQDDKVVTAQKILDSVGGKVARLLTSSTKLGNHLDELERLRDNLRPEQRERMADNLYSLAERAESLAKNFMDFEVRDDTNGRAPSPTSNNHLLTS